MAVILTLGFKLTQLLPGRVLGGSPTLGTLGGPKCTDLGLTRRLCRSQKLLPLGCLVGLPTEWLPLGGNYVPLKVGWKAHGTQLQGPPFSGIGVDSYNGYFTLGLRLTSFKIRFGAHQDGVGKHYFGGITPAIGTLVPFHECPHTINWGLWDKATAHGPK